MAWRRAAPGPAADALAELADLAAEYAAAAQRGDRWAAEHLGAVLSWMDMVRLAGGDGAIADLFTGFARDDRAIWVGLRGGVA